MKKLKRAASVVARGGCAPHKAASPLLPCVGGWREPPWDNKRNRPQRRACLCWYPIGLTRETRQRGSAATLNFARITSREGALHQRAVSLPNPCAPSAAAAALLRWKLVVARRPLGHDKKEGRGRQTHPWPVVVAHTRGHWIQNADDAHWLLILKADDWTGRPWSPSVTGSWPTLRDRRGAAAVCIGTVPTQYYPYTSKLNFNELLWPNATLDLDTEMWSVLGAGTKRSPDWRHTRPPELERTRKELSFVKEIKAYSTVQPCRSIDQQRRFCML